MFIQDGRSQGDVRKGGPSNAKQAQYQGSHLATTQCNTKVKILTAICTLCLSTVWCHVRCFLKPDVVTLSYGARSRVRYIIYMKLRRQNLVSRSQFGITAAVTHAKTGLKLVLSSYKLYVSALHGRTNTQNMKPTSLFESQAQVFSKCIIPGDKMSAKFLVTTWQFAALYKIRLHSVCPTHCQPLTYQKRPEVCELQMQFYF